MVDWLTRLIDLLEGVAHIHRRHGDECYSCGGVYPCLTSIKVNGALRILRVMKEEWEKGGAKTSSAD